MDLPCLMEYVPEEVRVIRTAGMSLQTLARAVNKLQKQEFGATVVKVEFTHDTSNFLRLRTNLPVRFPAAIKHATLIAGVSDDPNTIILQTDSVMNRRTPLSCVFLRNDNTEAVVTLYYDETNSVREISVFYR